MLLRWVFASLHLLALPLGIAAVLARARALSAVGATKDFARAFFADNLWGAAGGLWIVTGLVRAFAGLEKGAAYYLHARPFYVKMGLLVLLLALEVWPMVTLTRWRIGLKRGHVVDTAVAPALARISRIQAGLVVLMVFAATALARGFFY